jgi:hypothetical protein
VTGRETVSGTYGDRVTQGQFRATLIFATPEGRWLLVGLHLSPIAQGA